MKAGAIGRLGNVTKITSKTAKRQSVAYAGFCQRESLPSLFRGGALGVGGPWVSPPGNFRNQPRRNRRRTAAAPPQSEKIRRVDESVE